MRVLFLEDVINVADAGEVKEVANGFARNYLLPKNLATVATPEQLKRIARLKRTAEERRVRETGDWRALARILEGTTLHIPGKVGPTGKFYGAISVTRIIEELEAATNQKVQRRSVELSEPFASQATTPLTCACTRRLPRKLSWWRKRRDKRTTTPRRGIPRNPNPPLTKSRWRPRRKQRLGRNTALVPALLGFPLGPQWQLRTDPYFRGNAV